MDLSKGSVSLGLHSGMGFGQIATSTLALWIAFLIRFSPSLQQCHRCGQSSSTKEHLYIHIRPFARNPRWSMEQRCLNGRTKQHSFISKQWMNRIKFPVKIYFFFLAQTLKATLCQRDYILLNLKYVWYTRDSFRPSYYYKVIEHGGGGLKTTAFPGSGGSGIWANQGGALGSGGKCRLF